MSLTDQNVTDRSKCHLHIKMSLTYQNVTDRSICH